jgi:hypothetical protein
MFKSLLAAVSIAAVMAATSGYAMAQNAPKLSIPVPGQVIAKPAGARNSAGTSSQAIQIAQSGEQALSQKCAGKGRLFRFVPARVAGQPDGAGGFYAVTSGAKCNKLSLSQAVNAGLVTINP